MMGIKADGSPKGISRRLKNIQSFLFASNPLPSLCFALCTCTVYTFFFRPIIYYIQPSMILRPMIEKSWQWAKSRSLVRSNAVHGEEEAKLILEDYFHNSNERGELQQVQGQAEVEDPIASSIALCLSHSLIFQIAWEIIYPKIPKLCFVIVLGFGEDGCKVNQIHPGTPQISAQFFGRMLMDHYLITRL